MHVIDNLSASHFGKELYVVADRIEHHAGVPVEYRIGGPESV
jgi:hypothetical protein